MNFMQSTYRNQALTNSIFLRESLNLNLKGIMKKRIHFFIYLSAPLLLAGCMGYQLGGTRPEGIKSVYVAPMVNKTTEPAIEIQVTHALRQHLQFDGRMQLENRAENADAIVNVTLTDYTLRAIAFRDDLKTTAEQYRLRIAATTTLTNPQTGEIISESKTYGEATFPFESDLTTSKRDALPRAAQELAKFMVDDLIERW